MIIQYVKDDWQWRFPEKVRYNRYRGASRPAYVFWCFVYYVIKDALILYFYFAFRFFKFVFWDFWNWAFKIDESPWFIRLKEKFGIHSEDVDTEDDEFDYEKDVDWLCDEAICEVGMNSNTDEQNGICGGREVKQSTISFDEKMSWWKGDFFVDDIITLAIEKAYKDLQRTIRGFSNHSEHDIISRTARQTLHASVTAILSAEINSQSEFDRLHKTACYNLISSFKGQLFTVGQAQKWVNMTFKYLHLLDYPQVQRVYEYCHVPIDSYILNATNYTMIQAWSKLDDYHEYLGYQNWFRKKYPNDIPLDKEFYLWLEEAKKQM